VSHKVTSRHIPIAILLAKEVNELYISLREGTELKRIIDKGFDTLQNNMFAGDRIKKERIPKYYIEKYGINNLYRLRLDKIRRLCYTLIANEEGSKVVIIEIFLDHKSYDRRFGYKTS
jgi:hypothetical protein